MAATRYYLAQSLDGYLAEVDGGIDWLEDYEGEAELAGPDLIDGSYDEFIAGIGALAMGSATYEFVLGVGRWPYAGLPTWVFTSRRLPTMQGADIRFANGPVAPHHAHMTAAAGDRDVWLVGGGDLAWQFAADGLIDELILTVVPVVLGSGLPTFAGRLTDPLVLTGVRPFRSGMVELRYRFQGSAERSNDSDEVGG
ncbi:MAG: dihydrofolate reductase [Thermoleophilaceae bacterium]|nr:dihydrofolate reductase [Thermoleophilaceae bacterium]